MTVNIIISVIFAAQPSQRLMCRNVIGPTTEPRASNPTVLDREYPSCWDFGAPFINNSDVMSGSLS